MARSGSLAAWEQRLAAQRREEDRLARERRQREKDQERVRQQEHLESRHAIPAELVQAVALTGWVGSVDPSTGAPVRPRVLAMRAERPVFETLVLDAVDPIACLDRLNTLVSPP
jgi:restriction system protein